MADLAKSLRNILGREVDLGSASYYELVGLSRDEPDMQVIETAFRATTLYLKNVREKSSVEEWNHVAQLVQQAKNTLLDPGKKVAYDAKLKRSIGSSNEPPNNPSTPQQPVANPPTPTAATTLSPPAIEASRPAVSAPVQAAPRPSEVATASSLPSRLDPHLPLDVPTIVASLPKLDLAKKNEANWKEFARMLSIDPARWEPPTAS